MQINCKSNIHWGRRKDSLCISFGQNQHSWGIPCRALPSCTANRKDLFSLDREEMHIVSPHSLWRGYFTHSLDAAFNSSPAPPAWAAASSLHSKIFECLTLTVKELHSLHILQHRTVSLFKMNTVYKSSSGIQFIPQSQALELANNWHKKIMIQQPSSLLKHFPLWEGQGLSLSLCW